MASTISEPYKNADAVRKARDKVLAMKGKKYSDIISKNPIKPASDGSIAEELQWVDLVTAGKHEG